MYIRPGQKARGIVLPLSLSAYTRDAMTTAFRGTTRIQGGRKRQMPDAIERFVPPRRTFFRIMHIS